MSLGAIGGGSRKRAKDIVCRSNLRQWHLAMTEFTNDNDGSLWRGYNNNPTLIDWWFSALRDYHGDIDKIRCCPTATTPMDDLVLGLREGPGFGKQPFAAWGTSSWIESITGHVDYGSYGANGWIENTSIDYSSIDPSQWWRNIANIKTADNVPFLLDGQWIDAWPEPNHTPPSSENTYWYDEINSHFVRIVQNRHEEAENCAFMDGTVRKVGLKELWTLKWHRWYDTQGPWTLAGGVTPNSWPDWMRDMEAF